MTYSRGLAVCQVSDTRYCCFFGWWRRQWQPTSVHLPGNSHGQRSLVGCTPRRVGHNWNDLAAAAAATIANANITSLFENLFPAPPSKQNSLEVLSLHSFSTSFPFWHWLQACSTWSRSLLNADVSNIWHRFSHSSFWNTLLSSGAVFPASPPFVDTSLSVSGILGLRQTLS